MKKMCLATICLGLPLMISGTALAIPLATYTHNYGNGAGQLDPGGNDILFNGYVTVSDTSASRFNDSFNFSALNYGSIDFFDLTLSYSNTNSNIFSIPLEVWYARPGGTPDQFTSFKLDSVGVTGTSQTFRINSTLQPEFDNMVAAQNFYFWFAEETFGCDTFNLKSAKLTIDGTTPVPEPTTTFLVGIGIAGLAAVSRRRRS